MARISSKFLLVLTLTAFTLALFPHGSFAARQNADQIVKKSATKITSLEKNKKKRKFRHEWDRIIDGLDVVIAKYPASDAADKAMLLKGRAFEDIYKVSKNQKDLDSAVETYDACLKSSPGKDDSAKARARIKALTGIDPGTANAEPKPAKQPEPKPVKKADKKALPAPVPAPTVIPQQPAPAAPAPIEAPVTVSQPNTPDTTATPQIAAADKNDGLVHVQEIRYWSNKGTTRVVVALDGKVKYSDKKLKNPARLVFDLKGASIKKSPSVEVNDGILHTIRTSQYNSGTVRVVLDLDSLDTYRMLMLNDPSRLVIDITGKKSKQDREAKRLILKPSGSRNGRVITLKSVRGEANAPALLSATSIPVKQSPAPEIAKEAPFVEPGNMGAASSGSPPVTAVEPKSCVGVIVIDPGHGGKDTGAIGRGGLYEKDVVLDVGLRVKALVEEELGCKVVMTRDRDVFIDLDARPGIAVQNDADLFISIHANASPNSAAHGIETYLLNLTKDRNIMELAARE
ncbi:MAG TPA: N-acetylmuramoyl-L-alanine amidase, partial [Nitrospirota bacterium]